ncbi:hypothetical protein B296_00011270 [Ensete ventricosum]|uniref:Uncharacterized protein n=1 Tax=Ensete ventricosum TaxID=4639 RepID=A0A426Y5H7_ENSVE|nr:hypothetical protein B296_00011270 [Ensete ventricosum]
MGQVSYEYEYRVALARFQARYPDLEVDNDPFTEKPEDSLVVSAPLLHKGPRRAVGARPGPSDDQVKGGVDWMSVVLIELPPLTSGGLGYLYLRRDSSHGRHVIAMVLDTLPTAYSQGCWRLVGPSRSACHAAVHPLSGALQIGRPFALALSSRQPPDGGGAAGWSTRYVRSAMPSALFRAVGRLVTDKNVNKKSLKEAGMANPLRERHHEDKQAKKNARSSDHETLARGKRTQRRVLLKNMSKCCHSSCQEQVVHSGDCASRG